jgi:EAL domain-containing protein (putative c-di-GMP-specific phosphodiesterase class I)
VTTNEARTTRRALVIDNDPFTLDLAELFLRELGVGEVQSVSTGAAGLTAIDDPATVIDVVFCDLDMEGMNGVDVLRELSERHFAGQVVIMSGADHHLLTAVTRMAQAQQINFLGVLYKPLHRDKFETFVAQAFAPAVTARTLRELEPAEVADGLANGAIEPFVQPKVSVRTRQVKGGEVLLRWRDRDGSLLSPLAVIGTAERSGAIDAITRVMFTRAVEALGSWRRRGWATSLSVNVSARNLLDLGFPEWLRAHAAAAGADPHAVTLEITESQLVENLSSSLDVIARLYLAGFRLSIDDFGTGYSNFDQIKQLPLREIKIDRSLVVGASGDETGRAILASSIDLGRALGVKVTAEGVETLEDWAMLDSLGCDIIQGYFVSRPMPIDEYYDWCMKWDETHQTT